MSRRKPGIILAIPIAAVIVWGVVSCSDDTPACAGGAPKPTPALRMQPLTEATSKPMPRYTYKPPVKKPADRPTLNPPKPAKTKPTAWSQYKPPHTWGQPYGKGRPVPPQPSVIHIHNHDYRTYPGYPGYYGPGIFPIGYGAQYGCRAPQEGPPDD